MANTTTSSVLRKPRWFYLLLLGAFALHNVEEALTMPPMRSRIQAAVPAAASTLVDGLTPAAIWIALAGATALGGAFVAWGFVGRLVATRPYGPLLLAAVMGWNVLLPHVPAAFVLGGYAPGLVTAVLINAPLAVWAVWWGWRAPRISRRGLVAVVGGGAVLVPGATIGLMSAGRALAPLLT